MPKKILKIDQFHGGLNDQSDARDIADNELALALGVMVDQLGMIRVMGGSKVHEEVPGNSALPHPTANPGHGLFVFSHDRKGASLAREHLDETDFATHANWDVSGDVVDSGGNLTFTFASGTLEGTAQQVHGDRVLVGIPGIEYTFKYTVTVTTVPNFFALTLDNFPSASTELPFTAGVHAVKFTSHANCATSAFTITATDDDGGTTTQGVFTIDDVSLYISDETGDDYMVMADATQSQIDIYSKSLDAWSGNVIDLGSDQNMVAVFYSADGALRICDSVFTNTNNTNKWYGYAERKMFKYSGAGTNGETFQGGWFSEDQEIKAPTAGHAISSAAPGSVDMFNLSYAYAEGGDGNGWYGGGDDVTTNRIFQTGYTFIYDGIQESPIHHMTGIGTGDPSLFINSSGSPDSEITVSITALNGAWNPRITGARFYINQTHGPGVPAGWIFLLEVDLYNGVRNTLGAGKWKPWTFNAGTVRPQITKVECVADSADSLNGKYFDIYTAAGKTEVWIDTDDSGTSRPGGTGSYADYIEVTQIGTNDSNLRVAIAIASAINEDAGAYATASVSANTVYIQDTANAARTDATAGDAGFAVSTTQVGIASGGVGYAIITSDKMEDEPAGIPFQTITGFGDDTTTTLAKYKTAVVANRRTYIGNIQQTNAKGELVVKGDAMIKSPINQFDVFTEDNIVEASINDGDEIIKLETYADRILQFKKTKMHLINISKNIEFLEDTFMHKGVIHPASVCKTDFGIAWVNKHGVYLYDGQKVLNLFEKKGRRVINNTTWEAWTDETPIIGYFPKKRQLIIRHDVGHEGDDGDLYVFDMVTQSWTRGSDSLPSHDPSSQVTNFVTDWNGDLVISENGSSGGTASVLVKWVDDRSNATNTSNDIHIKTKDIDFGFPGVRKKIYRVHISYKGDGTALIVEFGINGDDTGDTSYYFEGLNSDGTPTGSSDGNPLLDKGGDLTQWHHAELKPDTSSEANNIYSFQLDIHGDQIPHDFEINDISIVYRLKNIK